MDAMDIPYDPDAELPIDAGLKAQLAQRAPGDPISVRGLRVFTLCMHHGCTRVNYEAHVRPRDGSFFWLTESHARSIGRALRGPMLSFGLSFTTFEGEGAMALAEAVAPGTRIDEVTFAHKSGDEVTAAEVRGFALLVTRVRARTAHLWAGEFDPGALDLLAQELQRLGNTSLTDLDVCDVSLPEPEDRIRHPPLEALVARNRTLC